MRKHNTDLNASIKGAEFKAQRKADSRRCGVIAGQNWLYGLLAER